MNSAHNFRWTFFAEGVFYLLSIAFSFLIIYFISPEEYGYLLMILPFFSFIQIFNSFWTEESIIIKEKNSNNELSSLFWFKLTTGCLLTVVFISLSSFISLYFKVEKVQNLIISYSPMILLYSANYLYDGILIKEEKFKLLAIINVISLSASITLGLTLAYLGMQIYSIILKDIFFILCSLALKIYTSKWLPKVYFRITKIRYYLKVGLEMTLTTLLGFFARNLDDVLIGRKYGSSSLSIYSKSYNLLFLPTILISRVFNTIYLPKITNAINRDAVSSSIYLSCVQRASFVIIPISMIIFYTSEELITLLLPTEWHIIIPFVKLFSILSILQSIWPLENLIYQGRGITNKFLKLSILINLILILSLIAIIFFCDNLYNVALFYSLINIPIFLCAQIYLSKIMRTKWYTPLLKMSPFLLSGLLSFLFSDLIFSKVIVPYLGLLAIVKIGTLLLFYLIILKLFFNYLLIGILKEIKLLLNWSNENSTM